MIFAGIDIGGTKCAVSLGQIKADGDIDILEKEEIITYREHNLEFLLSIRNGVFLDGSGHPTGEFYELVNEYEKRMKYAAQNSSLPDKPEHNKINDFLMSVNERIVKGTV